MLRLRIRLWNRSLTVSADLQMMRAVLWLNNSPVRETRRQITRPFPLRSGFLREGVFQYEPRRDSFAERGQLMKLRDLQSLGVSLVVTFAEFFALPNGGIAAPIVADFDGAIYWVVVTVQGEMVECNSLAEAAALRQADESLAGDGTRDPGETTALAVALFKYKHFEIARQLNVVARRRIDAALRQPD